MTDPHAHHRSPAHPADAPDVAHGEHADTVVGATGIDAVGAVYQWGQRLHETSP